MSQHIVQPIPSDSYQQEYCTIVINTPISGPMPLAASNGKSCPPFIEPLFLQTSSPASIIPNSSPISVPPTVPSPVNSAHQHELFKQLQNLPIWGYLTSTTNSDEQSNPVLKVWLPLVELVMMYELHEMLNDLAWHHIFLNAIDLMGNNHDLLSCWWHFDHCINTAIRLEMEAETQQTPPRTSLRGWNFSRSTRNSGWLSSQNVDRYIRRWRNIKIHWFGRHLKCHHPFPYWNFHILNSQDRHHPLLQLPHLTPKNCLQLLPALWNALGIQHHQALLPNQLTLLIFHHFLSHCLQHFKFPPSIITMVDHTTIDITQSQFTLQEAALLTWMEVPDHLLSYCRSPIDDMHSEHHMNKRGAHSGKCRSGLPLEDIYLCQIWNLQTRTGVMLWSLILSGTGTGMILSLWTLFHFSTALCASSITSFCHHA